MKSPFASLSLIALATMLGCSAAPEVVRSTRWDVHARHVTETGRPSGSPAAEIVRGSPYRVLVSLSPKDAEDIGAQAGEWVFYKGDLPFGRFETGEIEIGGREPTELALDAHSSAKDIGAYRYEFYLNDELVAEVPLEIIAPPKFVPQIDHGTPTRADRARPGAR